MASINPSVSIIYNSNQYQISYEAAQTCRRFAGTKEVYIHRIADDAPITSNGLREFANNTEGSYKRATATTANLLEAFAVAMFLETPEYAEPIAREIASRTSILSDLFGDDVVFTSAEVARAASYVREWIPSRLVGKHGKPETDIYFN